MNLDHLLGDKAAIKKPLETFESKEWDRAYELYPQDDWTQAQNIRAYYDSKELYANVVEIAGTDYADRILDGESFTEVFPATEEGKRLAYEVGKILEAHRISTLETSLDMPIGFLKEYPRQFTEALRDTVEELLDKARKVVEVEPEKKQPARSKGRKMRTVA